MFVTTNEDCKCPVCRYHQLPKLFGCNTTTTTCMSCEDTTNLWLCLSCNHIGCGRHEQAHALLHYQDSEHSHVMHLINFSIWNYKEHKYVHRLYSETPDVAEKTSPEINIKKEPSRQGDKEEDGGHFEKRIKLLENEWKNFSKLKETNRQMISIEQRLISLSEEKKLLEGKVREHDTK